MTLPSSTGTAAYTPCPHRRIRMVSGTGPPGIFPHRQPGTRTITHPRRAHRRPTLIGPPSIPSTRPPNGTSNLGTAYPTGDLITAFSYRTNCPAPDPTGVPVHAANITMSTPRAPTMREWPIRRIDRPLPWSHACARRSSSCLAWPRFQAGPLHAEFAPTIPRRSRHTHPRHHCRSGPMGRHRIAHLTTGTPWAEDTLQYVFSTTKGFTATCAHLVAQRG
jgi:hypothetical protein